MAYCEVPDSIDLQLMERMDESTLGGEHNGVFFTLEHLATGLRFLVSTVVKQFLHFTREPPALIHPNVIRIRIPGLSFDINRSQSFPGVWSC